MLGLQLSNDIDLNGLSSLPRGRAVILQNCWMPPPVVPGLYHRGLHAGSRGQTHIDLARLQELWGKLSLCSPYRKAGEFVHPHWSMTALPTSVWPRCAPMATPRVIIPVFPGTNCEYDTAAPSAVMRR